MFRYSKWLVYIFLLSLVFLAGTEVYADDWSVFQHDALHSGNSSVNFTDKDLSLFWDFLPTTRTWSYKLGSSVWSSAVSIVNFKDKTILYAGYYNNNFYAIDAQNGSLIWRFIGGNRFNYAPVFAEVNNRPMVFTGCADRSIYCLDALTGEKLWSYETLPWGYMVAEAITSAPLVVDLGNKPFLICAMWNASHKPFNNFQKGELYCLDAATGKKLYSVVLSATPLNSPAAAKINGEQLIFISACDGNLFALNARDGKIIWRITLDAGVFSSPAVLTDGQNSRIFIGSRFGSLYCLDALTGKIIWAQKVGHAVDATPAIAQANGRFCVYIGSYDRNIYCFDAVTGKQIWNYRTGDYVVSSCVLAGILGKPVVFAHSLDNKIYCLDAVTGDLVWNFDLGKLIWTYNTRGDTIWSSPSVGQAQEKPILVFPCYDGKLYAFSVAAKRGN